MTIGRTKQNRATNLVTFRLREDAFLALEESEKIKERKWQKLSLGTKCQNIVYEFLGIDPNDSKTVTQKGFKEIVEELVADRIFKVVHPQLLERDRKIELLKQRIEHLEKELELKHPAVDTVIQTEKIERPPLPSSRENEPKVDTVYTNVIQQDIVETTKPKTPRKPRAKKINNDDPT